MLQAYNRERFAFLPVSAARLDTSGRAVLHAPEARHVRIVVRGDRGWGDGTSRVLLLR